MEQELQSNLLRLSILIATSLSTLLEPSAPTIVADPSSSKAAGEEARLNKQILGDIRALFTAVQQACTNLTLALRPSTSKGASDAAAATSTYISPVAGLDRPSLEAANAQLVAIANEHVPKLVFLARKAQAEATLYAYVPKTKEDLEREGRELALVKARNGHVVRPAYARDAEKLEKLRCRGLGKVWSKSIVSSVFELFDALGQLGKTYMDDRTRVVLDKASAARDKADGIAAASTASMEEKQPATSIAEARQRALQATGVVWGVCDAALKGREKLIEDNREATRISWRRRTGVLKDALREFDDSTKLEEQDREEADAEADTADELLDGLADLSLSKEQKQDAKRYLPLLKAACQLHAGVGERYLGSKAADQDSAVDYDDLDSAGESIAEALDELISTILYGESFDETQDGEEDTEAGVDDDEEEVKVAVNELEESCVELWRAAQTEKKQADSDDISDALKRVRSASAQLVGPPAII